MPIGAITMILANVGLQIFNNWRGSRQNQQLQQKREEFEQAARERNTQRMWKLMREGQELTRQLEEEKHQQRLEELKNDIGSLLQKLTYAATINNWPLNVLPIVMKNQALGNLLANQEESIALHCIFTPSNSMDFNRVVFPHVEDALEAYCNQHWGVMSDHPILFYSGAWKSQQSPTEVQIDSMRTALYNLPTLVITPFFRPNDGKLVFHVRLWGVGASSSDEFSIPEIEPTEFQREYRSGDDYVNDAELMNELTEDIIPYLQCLIGYMADTYFWSSLGKAPHLPLLVTNGTINTDGMRYLVNESREYFDRLLLDAKGQNSILPNSSIELLNGMFPFWDMARKREEVKNAIVQYCDSKMEQSYQSVEEALNQTFWNLNDRHFITSLVRLIDEVQEEKKYRGIYEFKKVLDDLDFDYILLTSKNIGELEALAENGNPVAMYRLGEIYEYGMRNIQDKDKADFYYKESSLRGFILADVKCGKMAYNDIPTETELILRATIPIQMDVLYSESVLNRINSIEQIDTAIDRVKKTVQAYPYNHAGLIYNLASLMKIAGGNMIAVNNMFHVANTMGCKY